MTPPEDGFRPHTYDGIQEYDKRLPNWWLYTLYATILFWVGYWSYFEWFHLGPTNTKTLADEMAVVEAARLSSSTKVDDANLWQMSRNPVFVAAGKVTFTTTCVSCHNEKLTGGIGPNLVDHLWIHGGAPAEIYGTITTGVLAKGMPAWAPVLGQKKVTELTAYILSFHQENETREVQAAWTPIVTP